MPSQPPFSPAKVYVKTHFLIAHLRRYAVVRLVQTIQRISRISTTGDSIYVHFDESSRSADVSMRGWKGRRVEHAGERIGRVPEQKHGKIIRLIRLSKRAGMEPGEKVMLMDEEIINSSVSKPSRELARYRPRKRVFLFLPLSFVVPLIVHKKMSLCLEPQCERAFLFHRTNLTCTLRLFRMKLADQLRFVVDESSTYLELECLSQVTNKTMSSAFIQL